ncbi:Conserved_hypothetical protein [Hexamita inflata]|uniref:Uncharacterized protein n=1 Tax=Hexamita inflata TaxID=28002 RepID=A0AA86TUZ7_9EUKA|nr:Conserved hypothetical protein [Hexamita inflata]CAI9929875.1 Conserved hypothetical protein [Hexamita inflata]
MNSQQFTDALRQYLLSKNIKVGRNAIKIQHALDSIPINSKRRIWQDIGKILQMKSATVHNYYHNTWSTQFFDSLKQYRSLIKQMVIENLTVSNRDLVQKFIDMFPNKNFSKHNLQQVVYIQKQRLVESLTRVDGYSIHISECILFQDAVSM